MGGSRGGHAGEEGGEVVWEGGRELPVACVRTFWYLLSEAIVSAGMYESAQIRLDSSAGSALHRHPIAAVDPRGRPSVQRVRFSMRWPPNSTKYSAVSPGE